MPHLKSSFRYFLVVLGGGAFNDNFFKIILLTLIASHHTGTEKTKLISLTGALLVLPFIIFSPLAGWLADRFSKSRIALITRLVEPSFIILGSYFMFTENIAGLLFVLFLFGLQSALFSPSKFGIIPELVHHSELTRANGYVEMVTFMGILLGTAVGGQLHLIPIDFKISSIIILSTVLLIAIYSATKIRKTPAQNPDLKLDFNLLRNFYINLKEIRSNRNLFLVLLASSWFWFVGGLTQLSIFLYPEQMPNIPEHAIGYILTALILGIGSGSALVGRLSHSRVELGIVPVASFILGLAAISLGTFADTLITIIICFLILGFAAGFYIVPLNAYFQAHSPVKKRGNYLAASNIIFNLFILLASFALWFFNGFLGLDVQDVFLILGLISFVLTVISFQVMPELSLRCLNWILTNTLYKLKIAGEQHIPKHSGALLVGNHMSYADALIVLAASKRPVRFIMHKAIFKIPVINLIVRGVNVIPIDGKDRKGSVEWALNEASEAIKNGELVCIFAEGQLTRNGNLNSFRKGLERIMANCEEPIIPFYLDQVWGSLFSFSKGKFFWKIPDQIPYPLAIKFGRHLPAKSTAFEVRQKVAELGAEAFQLRAEAEERLDFRLISSLCKRRYQTIIFNSKIKVKGIRFLRDVLNLNQALKQKFSTTKPVGIQVDEPYLQGLVNAALSFSQQPVVNIDSKWSNEFINKVYLDSQVEVLVINQLKPKVVSEQITYFQLDELLKGITKSTRIMNWFLSFAPSKLIKVLTRNDGQGSDPLAIFYDPKKSELKGVTLSHANVSSNISALYQVLRLSHKDQIEALLNLNTAFGLSLNFWLPLLSGVKISYHNDLDRNFDSNIIFLTPKIAENIIEHTFDQQLSSFKYIINVADHLDPDLDLEFDDRFHLNILESFGQSELSPLLSLNIPDVDLPEAKQIGRKSGTVGHPLPNICVKIINPDTSEQLGVGEFGMVMVKGANVFLGYWNNLNATNQVKNEDWYNTGVIGAIDLDGFLTLKNLSLEKAPFEVQNY